jgi:hypothetical protein
VFVLCVKCCLVLYLCSLFIEKRIKTYNQIKLVRFSSISENIKHSEENSKKMVSETHYHVIFEMCKLGLRVLFVDILTLKKIDVYRVIGGPK